jgi:copper oxidase (laccase) domain-containing protein
MAHFIRYLHGINARNQRCKNCLKLPIQQKQGERLEAVQADVHTLKDGQAHTHTVLKTLATKQDVEVAVDAAKSELKADILMLDSKVVKRIQSHERRITNIEEQEGIENPDKN